MSIRNTITFTAVALTISIGNGDQNIGNQVQPDLADPTLGECIDPFQNSEITARIDIPEHQGFQIFIADGELTAFEIEQVTVNMTFMLEKLQELDIGMYTYIQQFFQKNSSYYNGVNGFPIVIDAAAVGIHNSTASLTCFPIPEGLDGGPSSFSVLPRVPFLSIQTVLDLTTLIDVIHSGNDAIENYLNSDLDGMREFISAFKSIIEEFAHVSQRLRIPVDHARPNRHDIGWMLELEANLYERLFFHKWVGTIPHNGLKSTIRRFEPLASDYASQELSTGFHSTNYKATDGGALAVSVLTSAPPYALPIILERFTNLTLNTYKDRREAILNALTWNIHNRDITNTEFATKFLELVLGDEYSSFEFDMSTFMAVAFAATYYESLQNQRSYAGEFHQQFIAVNLESVGLIRLSNANNNQYPLGVTPSQIPRLLLFEDLGDIGEETQVIYNGPPNRILVLNQGELYFDQQITKIEDGEDITQILKTSDGLIAFLDGDGTLKTTEQSSDLIIKPLSELNELYAAGEIAKMREIMASGYRNNGGVILELDFSNPRIAMNDRGQLLIDGIISDGIVLTSEEQRSLEVFLPLHQSIPLLDEASNYTFVLTPFPDRNPEEIIAELQQAFQREYKELTSLGYNLYLHSVHEDRLPKTISYNSISGTLVMETRIGPYTLPALWVYRLDDRTIVFLTINNNFNEEARYMGGMPHYTTTRLTWEMIRTPNSGINLTDEIMSRRGDPTDLE